MRIVKLSLFVSSMLCVSFGVTREWVIDDASTLKIEHRYRVDNNGNNIAGSICFIPIPASLGYNAGYNLVINTTTDAPLYSLLLSSIMSGKRIALVYDDADNQYNPTNGGYPKVQWIRLNP